MTKNSHEHYVAPHTILLVLLLFLSVYAGWWIKIVAKVSI